jgi:uncharacterized phage protein (predicted DNA packaging)
MMLVTLDQAKEHLRVDFDADDELIVSYIHAASAAVCEILTDSSGTELTPYVVKQATLLMVGEFYRNREPKATDSVDAQYGYGYLPRAVVALLYTLRDPAFA